MSTLPIGAFPEREGGGERGAASVSSLAEHRRKKSNKASGRQVVIDPLLEAVKQEVRFSGGNFRATAVKPRNFRRASPPYLDPEEYPETRGMIIDVTGEGREIRAGKDVSVLREVVTIVVNDVDRPVSEELATLAGAEALRHSLVEYPTSQDYIG